MRTRSGYTRAWDPAAHANLAATLAALEDAPPGVAAATLGLLPRDERAALVRDGLIVVAGAHWVEGAEVRITPRGHQAIADCARMRARGGARATWRVSSVGC